MDKKEAMMLFCSNCNVFAHKLIRIVHVCYYINCITADYEGFFIGTRRKLVC